jgi:hypothetical protein
MQVMEKIHHWNHVTLWWINGDDLKSRDAHTMPEDDKIKVINISGSIHKKVPIASQFYYACEERNIIFLDKKEPQEILVPTNEKPSQSEISTSGYNQNTEGRAF